MSRHVAVSRPTNLLLVLIVLMLLPVVYVVSYLVLANHRFIETRHGDGSGFVGVSIVMRYRIPAIKPRGFYRPLEVIHCWLWPDDWCEKHIIPPR